MSEDASRRLKEREDLVSALLLQRGLSTLCTLTKRELRILNSSSFLHAENRDVREKSGNAYAHLHSALIILQRLSRSSLNQRIKNPRLYV